MPSKEFNETLALLLLLDGADEEENDKAMTLLRHMNVTVANGMQETRIINEGEQQYMSTYDMIEMAAGRDRLVRITNVCEHVNRITFDKTNRMGFFSA